MRRLTPFTERFPTSDH